MFYLDWVGLVKNKDPGQSIRVTLGLIVSMLYSRIIVSVKQRFIDSTSIVSEFITSAASPTSADKY